MNSQHHKFLEFENAIQRANSRLVFLFALLYGCGFITAALGRSLVGVLILIAVCIPILFHTSRGMRLGRQPADATSKAWNSGESARWRKYDRIVMVIAISIPTAINIVRDLSRSGAVVLAVIATVLFYIVTQSWYQGFKDTTELGHFGSDEIVELSDDQLNYLAVLWSARCAVGFQEMKLSRLAKETQLSREAIQEITQFFIARGVVSVFEEYGSSGQKDVEWVQLTLRGCGLVKNLESVSSHS